MSMFIPHSLIKDRDHHNGYYYRQMLEDSDTAFLIIVQLHFGGVINDKRMYAMFKSLNDGTLLRHINTYNSKIYNKWFNNENMIDVLLEIYFDNRTPKRDIPVDVFLTYINKSLNKPKNYCIDVLFSRYIRPFIRGYNMLDYYTKELESFNIGLGGVNFVKFEDYTDDGMYCCEDCDGDYTEYMRSRYDRYVKDRNIEALIKTFNEYLNTLRNESYLKNPAFGSNSDRDPRYI